MLSVDRCNPIPETRIVDFLEMGQGEPLPVISRIIAHSPSYYPFIFSAIYSGPISRVPKTPIFQWMEMSWYNDLESST